jgi:predicted HTH transcriptional regulator
MGGEYDRCVRLRRDEPIVCPQSTEEYLTREEAIAVLESGNFEAFVGVEEDLEGEFKGEPYQLDQDVEKFELAKDCSALANASGGVIVIGVRTNRHAESPTDVGDEIRCLSRDLVDEVRYDWFGHTDDAIPYTNEEATVIDIEQIKSLR